jgi:hypothetical protein
MSEVDKNSIPRLVAASLTAIRNEGGLVSVKNGSLQVQLKDSIKRNLLFAFDVLELYESYVIEALSYELRLSENKLLGSSAIQLWRNGDCLFIYRANKTTAGLDLPEGQLERVASFSEWPM